MSRRTASPAKALSLYPTPAWTTRVVMEQFAPLLPRGRWLEPCAGRGNIIAAVDDELQPKSWAAIEINPAHARVLQRESRAEVHVGDARRVVPRLGTFDVAICNCPFPLAVEIVSACLRVAQWVFNLQRLDWMEGTSRRPFWEAHPCQVCPLPNRPVFVGRQDSGGYAWFVWHPDRRGRPNLWLPDVPLSHRRRRTPFEHRAVGLRNRALQRSST